MPRGLHSQQKQGVVGFWRKLCTEVVHREGFDRGMQEGRCHRQRDPPKLCSWPGSGMAQGVTRTQEETVRLVQRALQGRHEKSLGRARGGTWSKKPQMPSEVLGHDLADQSRETKEVGAWWAALLPAAAMLWVSLATGQQPQLRGSIFMTPPSQPRS